MCLCLPPVRTLEITIYSDSTFQIEPFSKFFGRFPKFPALWGNQLKGTICEFDPNKLFAYLRGLEISCAIIEGEPTFLSNLSKLSFLTKVVSNERSVKQNLGLGKHINFKTLLSSSLTTNNDAIVNYFKLKRTSLFMHQIDNFSTRIPKSLKLALMLRMQA